MISDKLKEWNAVLVKSGNYADLGIFGVKHCLDLADYILDFYFEAGKILEFRKSGDNDLLRPLALRHLDDGWWLRHYVASDSGYIYCPVLGEISKIDDYGWRVFGEEVVFKNYFPSFFD